MTDNYTQSSRAHLDAAGQLVDRHGRVVPVDDDALRLLWRSAGGEFHGPNIETGTMPEAKLLPFLRSLASQPPVAQEPVAWGIRRKGQRAPHMITLVETLAKEDMTSHERCAKLTGSLCVFELVTLTIAPPTTAQGLSDALEALRELVRLDDSSRLGGTAAYVRGSPWWKAWQRARAILSANRAAQETKK